VLGDGRAELPGHVRAGDGGVGGDAQGVPGVVIQPGQDLGAGAAGERVVGDVGLPALVRHRCLKADVGRPRALARLGDDQAAGGQVPADRGGRDPDLVVVFQVPGDGVRPGVQALPGQVLAHRDDQVGGLGRDRVR
jgi:hypothetical protein